MPLRGWLAASALLVCSACTTPPAPATPPPAATSTAPPPTPATPPTLASAPTQAASKPTAAPTAPATGTSRVEVLNAADAALASGNAADAAALYDRVINTPPTETAAAAVAITDYAHFRAMVALLAAGHEDEAQAHVEALRSREPTAPLPRLADQFWNQYTMTASAKAACNQVQPQIATQAAPVLQTLQSLGVTADPTRLCS